ncbi:MAG: PPOX class F420-dependent oxidoreductase [Chloroflexi bacterium]|nr:PPOX class F420-dependent oxidoreductase [Chloroflexota bacterium]
MLTDNVKQFLSENHRAVLTTFRKNGAAQMSILSVGYYKDGVAFTTTEDRAKLANLRRDPRCSLLVSKDSWWGFIVLEGKAKVMSADNTDADELRQALRDVFVAASGEEHPNWDEYDQAMRDDRRSAIIVVPDRIYGTAL